MAAALKILLVEDDSDDAEFLRLSLAQHNSSAHVTHTGLISDAVTVLDNERFDVVLLDLNLPDGRGVECVEKIHEIDELVPIVVLSGHDDEDFAVDILNRGVQDYLVKWEGDGRVILRAIRYAIERKRAEIKVNYLARLDWLTCIPNRQYLREELAHATTHALRGRSTMALLRVDLDGFKKVNETLGHAAGDTLLKEVVQRLTESIREGDLLARLGSDDFAAVLENVEGAREVDAVALKVNEAFQEPFQHGGQQVAITASVGISLCPVDGTDAEALLANAESALRQVKENGQNAFRFFSAGMQEETQRYRQLENELKLAIEEQQFELLYQPQIRLADHRIEAVEALVRWKHPERGSLSPGEFISVAEESGHIVPLGLWVIEEVCRQLGRWESAGVPVPRVTINIAAAQFREPGFHEAVRGVLQAHSVEPGLIELELPVRSVMDDADDTQEILYALKSIGVLLAIDDFGSGYSSLDRLRQLPLDVLKIDRSFVSNVDTSDDAKVVCTAILAIAHRFSLDAVAKGVESPEQEAFLSRHDCLYGQGDHFSPPMGPEPIRAMLAERGGQATRQRRVTTRRVAKRAG